MTLDDEERKLLSGLPCDSEGIKVKLDFILSVQKRLDNRPEWRQKTSHIFLSFCKVIDKTSALVQPMLPQAAEWTVTYGILTLLFKSVVTNNTRAETLLEYLDELSESLPLVDFYETIFPTAKLQCAVAKIYAAVMKFLDEALSHYHSNRFAKLAQALFRPQSRFEESISQIKKEVRIMELLKNAAHEAQAVDVQSTVNQTAEDVSKMLEHLRKIPEKEQTVEMQTLISRTGQDLLTLQENFRQRLLAVEYVVETLHEKTTRVESTVNQMRMHSMVRHAQGLQESLLTRSPDQLECWDAGEALARFAAREFRLSQKDHWENNGILPWLQRWSDREADRSQMLWIGGHSGNQDSWVTELSVDIAQMLLAQQLTAIVVLCSDFHESSLPLTPTSLVRILIDQLFENHPEVPYNDAAYFSSRRIRNARTFFSVWEIFERLVTRSGDVFIIIDRIEFLGDDDDDWESVLLPPLLSLVQSASGLRVIITSECKAPEYPGLDDIYIDTTRSGRMIQDDPNFARVERREDARKYSVVST